MVSHLPPILGHDDSRSRRQIVLQKRFELGKLKMKTAHPSLPDEANPHTLFLVEYVETGILCDLLHFRLQKRSDGKEDAGKDASINLAEEVALVFSWICSLE